jgi:hypothetical protein
VILKPLAKAPAQPPPDFGFQHDLIFAAVLELQSADAIDIDDDRAVNDAPIGPDRSTAG